MAEHRKLVAPQAQLHWEYTCGQIVSIFFNEFNLMSDTGIFKKNYSVLKVI